MAASSRPKPIALAPHVLAELYSGPSVALLQALHILTRDGRLNQDSRRKLKQVNHLLQFNEPLLQQAIEARGDVALVDHGAGKSYLGFLLYDRFFAQRAQGAAGGWRRAPIWCSAQPI